MLSKIIEKKAEFEAGGIVPRFLVLSHTAYLKLWVELKNSRAIGDFGTSVDVEFEQALGLKIMRPQLMSGEFPNESYYQNWWFIQ